MTIDEFKAWLDGFSEAIDGAPTAEQWQKVKDKIETLSSLRLPPVSPYPASPSLPPVWPGIPVLPPLFGPTCKTANFVSSNTQGH